ncbi:MAG TPA: methyltransferase domain-containing protein [Polyangiaceae bacterium]|jgi:SAM-dependent methyltransferase|nr:methyltransferase domain-containing protein [Polyangiaceae bacterium]
MSADNLYVHGTHPEEQARLTRLNALLNEGSLRELGARAGERMLDVGSGLGQFARAVAKITGVRVVGVERSGDQIAESARQAGIAGEEHLLDLRHGDAQHLPLEDDEWATFDVAHARFLLEHVREPLEIVKGMVRAVRPGGRIVLEDDDHDLLRLWPEPPGVAAIWKAYMRTYDRAGNDPFTGRRLVQLLHQAGVQPRRSTWIFFGACAGHADFELYVENLAIILEEAREGIVAIGTSRDDLQSALVALRAWKRRPDAAFWFAMSWAEGVRPG